MIYVHGKGDKFRSIPLLRETGRVLSKYIDKYGLCKNDAMFTNTNGNRLTRQGVCYIIKKYAAIVNNNNPGMIDTRTHPHSLRRSKASHLVDKGVSIYNVRDFLGHESVATTQVYLTSNPEVTCKAIETASEKTIPNSMDYYSKNEKSELLDFLKSLG